MRRFLGHLIAAAACIALTSALFAASEAPPPWAYGFPAAAAPGGAPAAPAPAAGGGGGGGGARGGAPAAPPDESLKQLSGAAKGFTLAQIRDAFGPADWYPGDHPQMPEVVAHGKRPDVRACSLCHYPNGKGRPENAGVSGLPISYFIQTMDDFRKDLRKSADTRKANTNIMIQIAKGMTDEEIKAAAQYFSSMK